MQDILLSHKQYYALIKRLDEINEDVTSLKCRSLPDVGFIDTYELLKLLHVTPRTVQRWRKSGSLPYSKVGGRYYYKADIILDSFKMRPDCPVAIAVGPLEVRTVEVDPVEIEHPPPVVEKLESDDIVMKCKSCPLYLLLIS